MNPKFVMVAVGSAVFAAGLTYWVVSPVRNGGSGVAVAKMAPAAPAAPPLVISTAVPPSVAPVASTPVKRSPVGAPLAAKEERLVTAPVTAAPPPLKPLEEPAAAPVPAPAPAPPPVVTAAPPPPPARVALSPPKEIDRPVEPAVLRERASRNPNTVTINAGTTVTVRLGETLSVQKNLTGDTFFATLDAPLVAEGFVIAEKGARVEGRIVGVDKAGRLSGTSRLSLELTQVNTSDGQRLHLQTSPYTKDGADRNNKADAAKIGGGAILGAIIGAAAGGGKGAAVGAGAGWRGGYRSGASGRRPQYHHSGGNEAQLPGESADHDY